MKQFVASLMWDILDDNLMYHAAAFISARNEDEVIGKAYQYLRKSYNIKTIYSIQISEIEIVNKETNLKDLGFLARLVIDEEADNEFKKDDRTL